MLSVGDLSYSNGIRNDIFPNDETLCNEHAAAVLTTTGEDKYVFTFKNPNEIVQWIIGD
jgi:hypothetical protein